jgi:hypothetical protein
MPIASSEAIWVMHDLAGERAIYLAGIWHLHGTKRK